VANAGALSEALRAAEDELHGLLGGERDAKGSVRPWLPKLARPRLTWKPRA
jgi:hypothetical protein